MDVEFRDKTKTRRIVGSGFVLISLIYLTWRLTIFNPHAMGVSIAFYAAEVIGVVLAITTVLLTWTYRVDPAPQAPAGLSVDVFVLCYNEPEEIIQRTLEAAANLDYPHTTWLLDDGRRPEMKALAEHLSCRYLTRDTNVNAKAGNINHALTHAQGEFVVVFDGDHVPLPEALDRLLGYFDDPKVAMVQAPQDYYNTDSIQYFNQGRRGALWHDQSHFYHFSQPCRYTWNAVTCCGTSVAYRRSALNEIGGIPTDTVTEDTQTSLRLLKSGFELTYVPESIAYGLAAADISDYYRTRLRWGHGNIHVLRAENILFCRGLTLAQRLSYLATGIIYLEGWQSLITFAVPVIALTIGLAPFEITYPNIAVIFSFSILAYLFLQQMCQGFGRVWGNELFSMTRFPVYIAACAGLFRDRRAFRSSAKVPDDRIDWLRLTPQIIVLVVSLGAIIVGSYQLLADFSSCSYGPARPERGAGGPLLGMLLGFCANYTADVVVIAGFWAGYNALRAAFVVWRSIQVTRNLAPEYRHLAPIPVEIEHAGQTVRGVCAEISTNDLRLTLNEAWTAPQNQPLHARLWLPSMCQETRLTITRMEPAYGGGTQFWANLQFTDNKGYKALSDALYSVNWYREFVHGDAKFLTPASLLHRRLWRSRDQSSWVPVLYSRSTGEAGTGNLALGILRLDESSAVVSLLCFDNLPVGEVIVIAWRSDREGNGDSFKICQEDHYSTPVRKGLDGRTFYRFLISAPYQTEALATATAPHGQPAKKNLQ